MDSAEIRQLLKEELVTPHIIDEFIMRYGDCFEDSDEDDVLEFFEYEYGSVDDIENGIFDDWGWGKLLSE